MTPRLSETMTGPREYGHCSGCGAVRRDDARLRPGLSLWQECDDHDKPEPIYLWLCGSCENQIEPHPRQYMKLDGFSAAPGAMRMCSDCVLRSGLRCTAHEPEIHVSGSRAFVDGHNNKGRRTGWIQTVYWSPPKSCDARQTTRNIERPVDL